MSATHKTGSREQWRAARIELLKAEKEHTRQGDEVAKQRQALPWVRIDKEYSLHTDEGQVSLKDLFKGRSQLLVYHLMFGPDYTAACPSCSSIADGFNGIETHLENHDAMLWAISRAPLAKLQAFKKRMGWTFPWASSFESEFNYDFNVWFADEQYREGTVEYNYHREEATPVGEKIVPDDGGVSLVAAQAGVDGDTFIRERPGMSAFAMQDGAVYHTYSAYARGLDELWCMYQWLDRAPLGRNEDSYFLRHHDAYGK